MFTHTQCIVTGKRRLKKQWNKGEMDIVLTELGSKVHILMSLIFPPSVARGDTPALYTVLPEKTSAVGAAVMGSSHVYDLSAVSLSSLQR